MKTILLELDELDYDAIQTAIARRQTFDLGFRPPLPDGEGNMGGRVLAEICRGWMAYNDLNSPPEEEKA